MGYEIGDDDVLVGEKKDSPFFDTIDAYGGRGRATGTIQNKQAAQSDDEYSKRQKDEWDKKFYPGGPGWKSVYNNKFTIHKEDGLGRADVYFMINDSRIKGYTDFVDERGDLTGTKWFYVDLHGIKKAVIRQLNNRLGWSLSSAIRSATSIASKMGLKQVLDSVNTALKIPGVKGLVSMVPGLGISITALQQGSALLDSVTSGNVKSQAKLAKIAMLAKSGNPAAIKLRKALRALYLNKKRQALLAARRGVAVRPSTIMRRDNRSGNPAALMLRNNPYGSTMIQGYEIGQDDCNEMSGWLYNKPFRAMEDDAFAPRKLYSRGMTDPATKFSWK
jgi:hypothetical protein